MSRYNHFAPIEYAKINFNSLQAGQKFRLGKWKGNKRRYLIMQKTGDLSYTELRSKMKHELHNSDLIVYEYERK